MARVKFNDQETGLWEYADVAHGNGFPVSGMTAAQIKALDGMFKVCAFIKADISAEYAAFCSAFGIADSGGSGDDSGGETGSSYTVTNKLTNVKSSNSATTANGYYSATLSAEDGYTINVTVTMGGVDITEDVYTEDGTILITEVTGDIVITATAELAASTMIYQLANTPVTCNGDLFEDTGLTFGSSSANGLTKAWSLCADVVVGTNQTAVFGVNDSEAGAKCLQFQTNGAGTGLIYICNNSDMQTPANTENRHRFVITHAANSNKVATVHRVVDGAVVSTDVSASYGNFGYNGYAGNLHVGGKSAGAFVGTINEFAIHEGVLSAAHIAEFLGVG